MVNHEVDKLVMAQPGMSVLAVYLLMLLAAAVTARRATDAGLLDFPQTEQMKGMAILLIVAGHLNHIVPVFGSLPNFADYGVSVFLFASGFGLTRSAMQKGLSAREFFLKRVGRIYLSYWVVTLFALAADYLVLYRHYGLPDIAATLLGVNVNEATRHIDYVRWFVTFIIVMYLFFFASFKAANTWKGRLLLLWACALAMDAALLVYRDSPVANFAIYGLAFPLGALTGVYLDDVARLVNAVTSTSLLRVLALVSPLVFLAVDAALLDAVRAGMGSAAARFAARQIFFFVFLLLLVCSMGALGRAGYKSALLVGVGALSYEIFLLHGLFLIKYDFIVYRGPLVLYFPLFLVYIIALSYLLNRSVTRRGTLVLRRADG